MVASELIALAAKDAAVRRRLGASGALFGGYHPEMEAVHAANAARLERILDAHGWPDVARFGEAAAEAAWLIAQHAIGLPAFQRRCLACVREAAACGTAPQPTPPSWRTA